MAKAFLDVNIIIDFIEKKQDINNIILDQELFVSPLSFHILMYVYKYRVPNNKLIDSQKYFNFVPFNDVVTQNALLGPTIDFEDNVQLHSAADAECDVFLTNDKKLLNLKFFGKTKIIQDFGI